MKKILVLDTETFDTGVASNRRNSLYETQLPFEVAWFDPAANQSHEYIIAKFEANIKENYFVKIGKYKISDFDSIERKSLKDILLMLEELSKDYEIWAYNSLFDEMVLKKAATKLNIEYKSPKFKDIMVPFTNSVYKTKEYFDWAKRNDRVYSFDNKVQPRKTAEDAYNYLLGKDLKDRVPEAHTALEDCKYEWEILKRLI